jgi:glycosyltransferase involved in cell wall biosynthesis
MNVLVVSGIWPPDVGGPAVHAPAVASHLHAHRHGVAVVTTASATPAPAAYPVFWVSRALPVGLRHAAVSARVARAARRADVVYATSMVRRAVAAAGVARRPVVVKLVADEAYERARRTGAFAGTLEEFQTWPGSRRVRALRGSRTAALRRAAHVFVPSAYLRGVALGWGLDPARVTVLPNAAPPLPQLPSREALRAELGLGSDELVIGFAGRLTRQKALPNLFRALADVPAARLVVRGDGPEAAELARLRDELGLAERVVLLGGGDRGDVLRLFAAVDVAVLPSAWENFPHTVVEALAVGTPVVASAVGGVPEIVVDGENGLLVAPGDVPALASALAAVVTDTSLRARLAAGAAPSVAPLAEERLLAVVESTLLEVVA